MAGGNDTAALVVALSAKLDKFEKDMKGAGDIADRAVSGIEDRFAKSNPSFAGSFLGNFLSNFATKGIEKAIDFVVDLKDRFVALDAVAKLTGESMNNVFGLQEAASKAGTPIADVTTSLKSLAVLLDQMQRGEKNSLTALFDANPEALRGVNREALTLQQTFAIVANLVQNAKTEIQKIDLAKAAGQAETMVPFLEKGGKAVSQLQKDAAAAAPDLQKLADAAKEFDSAWNKAVQNVKAYFVNDLFASLKQDLTDIIAIIATAQKLLGLFGGQGTTTMVDAAGNAYEAQLANANGVIAKLDEAKKFLQGIQDRQSSREEVDFERRRGQAFSSLGGAKAEQSSGQNGTSTRDRARALSNTAKKDQAGAADPDSFNRTEEQITRHTASVNADTQALFQNNAAQAQLRAEFQLLNALRKDGAEVTQEQVDKYQTLRASMTAEQALVEAHINLSPAHKQSFLSASEGARSATENYDKARESLNRLNSASSQIGSALSSAFADAVVEGKSLNDTMVGLLKTLEKAAINSIFASFFNPTAAGGTSAFGSILKGIIPGFASGTNSAPGGLAMVGENGPELVNLPKGSQVIPNSALPARGGGGITVVVNNSPVFQAGMTPTDMAAIRTMQDNNNQQLRGVIVSDLRRATANDSRFLG